MGGASAIGRELRDHLSKTMRDVMLTVESNLINATPVDSGHASSNWILTTGAPNAVVDGSRESVSTTAQEAGIRKIQNYDVGRDGPIYLNNLVLYIQFLDRGWSQQAPPGFVAMALQGALFRAPAQRKAAVSRMLRNIAHAAYIRTY